MAVTMVMLTPPVESQKLNQEFESKKEKGQGYTFEKIIFFVREKALFAI